MSRKKSKHQHHHKQHPEQQPPAFAPNPKAPPSTGKPLQLLDTDEKLMRWIERQLRYQTPKSEG